MSEREPAPRDDQPDAAPSGESHPGRRSLKHELRTPLNHIIGYCEMLLEEAQDQQLEVFVGDLQRIHSAGRRLLAVINDLFEASGPAGKTSETLLHHEVRTPLNQIIGYSEMLQEEAQDSGRQSFIPDLEKIHAAARNLLELVVQNLDPLRTGTRTPGAESDTGATTFVRSQPTCESGPAADVVLKSTTPPSSLLVVDDNVFNRDMLGRRLERLGHKVTQASNGLEALEKMQKEAFDLVLLDILMPELNGYQVLERLSEDPALRGIPVIVLSASDDTASVARCVAMGAEDYLAKPFDPVLLQARINACLEQKRMRDQEASYLRQIEEEKKRSDELLHIILPRDVAAELKSTQSVRPRRYENVAVLFCDIAGFTPYCEKHSPEQILDQLQTLVEAFEHLTAEHHLEKIKTIGDSYMAVAGLLSPLDNPALNAVQCGLGMVAAARELPPHWNVRVGIHVGPVIAGVVGKRKYQYDVWGDTVNMAARMEQAAGLGTVCVNSETWELLKNDCRGELRSQKEIKGKGLQKIWSVVGQT